MQQGNFINVFFSSTCFGDIRPSSGALDVELQHMVFCTDFLDGWWSWELLRAVPHHPHRTHDLHSGSQDHHPSKNSVQKTIYCNSTSNAPDDGRMYPKQVALKNTLIKLPYCIKLAFQIISLSRCTVKQPSNVATSRNTIDRGCDVTECECATNSG